MPPSVEQGEGEQVVGGGDQVGRQDRAARFELGDDERDQEVEHAAELDGHARAQLLHDVAAR